MTEAVRHDATYRALRSGLVVSFLSVVWTAIAGSAGIAVGLSTGSGALVAFSAVGIVDALGSLALCVHFGMGLRGTDLSTANE